eukprot:2848240-Pyramimonas_sp.AAC.1
MPTDNMYNDELPSSTRSRRKKYKESSGQTQAGQSWRLGQLTPRILESGRRRRHHDARVDHSFLQR